jgi:predicted transcriptional regulator
MQTVTKPLAMLTAADIMSHDPLVVPKHMPIRTAAHLLSERQVSGAPVVNVRGVCVGVLSATDFMQWAEGKKRPHWSAHECACSDWQIMEPEHLPEDEVSVYMTPDPVVAQEGTSVFALARMMLNAHIHRVIIVDSVNRPVGIVTSTDILAAITRAEAAGE